MSLQLNKEIMTTLKDVYRTIEKMKDNVQQAPLVVKRLEALWKLVFFLDQRKEVQLSDVKKALENFLETLQKAELLNIKFAEAHKMNQMWKSLKIWTRASLMTTYRCLGLYTSIGRWSWINEKKMSKLEAKLAEQEKTLEETQKGVASNSAHENNTFYCVLQWRSDHTL